jgi:hypothetical protein
MPPRSKALKRAHKAAAAEEEKEEGPNKRAHTEEEPASDEDDNAPNKVSCKSDVDQRYALMEDSESMAEPELGLQSLTQAAQDGPPSLTHEPAAAAAAVYQAWLRENPEPKKYSLINERLRMAWSDWDEEREAVWKLSQGTTPATPKPAAASAAAQEKNHTSAAAAADAPHKAPVSPGVGAAHASTVPSPFVLDDYVRFKDDPAGERYHVRGGKRGMVYIDTDDGLGFVASAGDLEKVPVEQHQQEKKEEVPNAVIPYPFVLGDRVRFKAGEDDECYTVAGGMRSESDKVYINADGKLGFVASASDLEKVPVERKLKAEQAATVHRIRSACLARIQTGSDQGACGHWKIQHCREFLANTQQEASAASAVTDLEKVKADETGKAEYTQPPGGVPVTPPAHVAAASAPPPPLKRQPSVRRFMKCEECHQRKPDVHEVCGGGWVVCESCRFSSEED